MGGPGQGRAVRVSKGSKARKGAAFEGGELSQGTGL